MSLKFDDRTRTMISIFFLIGLCFSYFLFLNHYSYFPLGAHPDELTKIRQIMGEEEKFLHPQLLVQLNFWLNKLFNSHTLDSFTTVSRAISNLLAALTILLLSLSTRILSSKNSGMLFVAIFLMFDMALFESGRYIKEDIYFLFSLSVNIYCLCLFFNKKNESKSYDAFLGCSYGLIISSKYSGTFYCLFQLWVLIKFYDLKIDLKYIAKWFLFIFLIINNQLITDLYQFGKDFDKEVRHSIKGHGDIYWPWYSNRYFLGLWNYLNPFGLLILFFTTVNLKRIKDTNSTKIIKIVLLSAIFYFLILQISPLKLSNRYIYPVILSFHWIIMITIIMYQPHNKIIFKSIIILFLAINLTSMISNVKSINLDTYTEFLNYINSINKKIIISDGGNPINYTYLGKTQKFDSAKKNIKSVHVGRYCIKNNCDNYDLKIISCREMNRYFMPGIKLTNDGEKLKTYYLNELKNRKVSLKFYSREVDYMVDNLCVYIFE